MPKFSIIVPVYQVEKYLDKCLKSILRQSYQDFEVILVDDGSRDASGGICDRYAREDSRLRVIHKENGGLSDARNAGLRVAAGEYIYFVDGDDYIEENLLERVLDVFQKTRTDMVAFGYKCINENEEVQRNVMPQEKSYALKSQQEKYDYFVRVLLQYGQCWEAWNRVYRGDIIRENALWFVDNDRIFAEDILFLLMYLMYAERITGIGDLLYCYLTRENSIMGNKGKRCNAKEITELAKCFWQYLEERRFKEKCWKNYPVIFGILLFNEGQKKSEEAVEAGLKQIREDAFVYHNAKALYGKATKVRKYFGPDYTGRLLGFCEKLYGDKWTYRPSLTVRAYQKVVVRGLIPYLAYWRHRRNIFLIGSEDAGNLGDHQIAVSIREFLKYYFPQYKIIEIEASDYRQKMLQIKKYVRNWDWICTPGGGNLGDAYPYSETIRRDVISAFPKNKIIIFPQTVYFSNTEEGKLQAQRTREIYCGHKKLLLTVRDRQSLQQAAMIFNGRVELVPDIVLFSDRREMGGHRKGALLCLRSDFESCLNEEMRKVIEKAVISCGLAYKYIDHQYAFDIMLQDRDAYLREIMRQYQSAELVITDRLHGMIFAAITGTPCVVLDNYNHKISGVHEWIGDLQYIIFCDSIENIQQEMEKVLVKTEENANWPARLLRKEFDKLAEMIAH